MNTLQQSEERVATSTRSPRASGVRIEIQALRTIAVLGVVLFHLWPTRLAGGYIGVDVFFVVSGFLISDHLLREVDTTGRVSLARFWARRAKRLLPASLLTLAVTAVAVWLWVPDTRWAQFGHEIVASATYVENWALAAQSVDYMALSNAKSPVQHFWSLGVEEQFYIAWPILILLSLVVAARLRRSPGRAVWWMLAAVAGISLCYSIYLTAAQASVAYFSTFTRAWEFAAGGLLALWLRRTPRPFGDRFAPWASWLGLAMIAVAMVLYDGSTPFPSFTAALPVIGAIVVIAAGAPSSPVAPTRVMAVRPVQFVGDVSYGVYLWHWPLVVLVPYAIAGPITTPVALAILVGSLALGWLSKRFVEDPVRKNRVVAAARPRWVLLGTAGAMAIVVAIALPLASHRIVPPQPATQVTQANCYGAGALLDASCGDAEAIPLVASASSFSIDLPPADILACERSTTANAFQRCDFGDTAGAGPHVALIGDSHGTRLAEPLRTVVEKSGGSLSTFLVSGCSMMSRELTGSAWGYDAPYAAECQTATTGVQDAVIADPRITTVVLTDRTRLYVTDRTANHPLTQTMVEDTIRFLEKAGKRVVVVKDPPEMHAIPPQGGGSAADCIQSARTPEPCSLPRAQAEFADPMAAAAKATGATLIDLDRAFCTASRCLSQIGGLVVYSDDNHMTRSFANSLVPYLANQLSPILKAH